MAREIWRVGPAPAAIRRWRDRHRHLAGVALHAPERHDTTIEREHDLALRRHVIAGRRHAQQLQVTRPRRHRRNRERSEEHTSELQSLMRISYAVFCLKKKTVKKRNNNIQ